MNLGKRQLYCSALTLVACLAWASTAHAKTAEELTIASSVAQLVTMGGRTLRADAMALVALAALFARWREF